MIAKEVSLATVVLIFAIGCAAVPSSNSRTLQSDIVPTKVAIANNVKVNTKLRSGSFISGEHQTDGMASIVQENGIYFIELDQSFKTSENGPDLFVVLHRSPNILKISKPPDYGIAEGDYVAIAPLKSFNGKQRYEIPRDIQPDSFQSVAVWCRKYNATFGFAPLSGA